MNSQPLIELLIYMTTSATALKGEPDIYAPLRLIETTQRLAQYLIDSETGEETLQSGLQMLIQTIETGKTKCMTDEAAFYNMLDACVLQLIDICE
jgi:hypothetical protein